MCRRQWAVIDVGLRHLNIRYVSLDDSNTGDARDQCTSSSLTFVAARDLAICLLIHSARSSRLGRFRFDFAGQTHRTRVQHVADVVREELFGLGQTVVVVMMPVLDVK